MHLVDLLRRTIGFVVFGVLVWQAVENDWLVGVFDSPGQIAAVVGIVVASLVLIWAITHPTGVLTIVAFIIGGIAVLWAEHVFDLETMIELIVVIGAGFALWALTVLDRHTITALPVRGSAPARNTTT